MLTRLGLASGTVLLLMVSTASAQTQGSPPGGTPGGPPGGFKGFDFPQPGQILSAFIQDQLKLSPEQKKQIAELQKDVDAKLTSMLTPEQKKSMQNMRPGKGGFGPPGGKGGFGPPPGGFGGFGAKGTDDVKKQIGATDEEWKVIGPKLQKVIAARRVLTSDARTSDITLGGQPRTQAPPGDPPIGKKPGPDDPAPGKKPAPDDPPPPGKGPGPGDGPRFGGFGGPMGSNIITQAQADLKNVLDDPKHTKAEVAEKIAAIRKARQTARADLDAAQRNLLPLLTASQEAILVSLGYLE